MMLSAQSNVLKWAALFFQAEDGIRDFHVTGVQTCALPICMKLIAINRKTGMRAAPGEPGTIIEAFKPGTGPADTYWVIGMGLDGSNGPGAALSPGAAEAIQSGGGGLY